MSKKMFVAVGAVTALIVSPAVAVAEPAPTVVTITFDDGTADQLPALDVLDSLGLKSTLYVNSGRVSFDANYMTSGQLVGLQSRGHEIAGHTITHVDLPSLPPDLAKREICDDRVALAGMGLTIKNFAYPFASYNATVQQIVRDCGYNSARSVADLRSVPFGCANCDTAESIPPRDPYAIRTGRSVQANTTLDNLKTSVTQAENNGGGWVPILFHHVGTGEVNSITLQTFTDFATWLAARPSTTVVKTVDGVIGGSVQPLVAGPPVPQQAPNLVKNQSLEEITSGVPTCFQRGGYGSNTVNWSNTSDAHSGQLAERLDMTGWVNGDRKLVQTQNSGTCAPVVTPGKVYTASVWHKGSGTGGAAATFVVFYRDSAGAWIYWQTGNKVNLSTTWKQASYTTPAIPAGATALSFGLALVGGNGNLTTDDYSLLVK